MVQRCTKYSTYNSANKHTTEEALIGYFHKSKKLKKLQFFCNITTFYKISNLFNAITKTEQKW